MPEPSFEDFRVFLPAYLSPENKEQLFEQLKRFPGNRQFYTASGPAHEMSELLQGDGWRGFIAINFATRESKRVTGIILSNSCDVDPANQRDIPVKILFAPLLSLGRYIEILRDAHRQEAEIDTMLATVRAQRVTSLFYLPALPGDTDEKIVLLDDVHSHPLSDFLASTPQRVFRLNQYAFYLFLFKLSLHLMRFQEGVDRGS